MYLETINNRTNVNTLGFLKIAVIRIDVKHENFGEEISVFFLWKKVLLKILLSINRWTDYIVRR